jgi:enoyl-CoA hydratase/carnithine racemase
MDKWQTIIAEKSHDRIGIITFNRPELRNAISIRMRQEISACLDQWRDDPGVGVVIFTGAGAAFTAGFDLKEFKDPALFETLFATSSQYHRDIWKFPKPTIAAVNGMALAGGFDLAKLCDIRICASSAVFGHPEIKFGVPPLFTPLRWIIGEGLARDLCLTGRNINADEAYRIGLVSEVAPPETLMSRAHIIAGGILEAPLAALQMTKAFLMDNAGRGLEESFLIEHDEAFHKVMQLIAGGLKSVGKG